MQNQEEADEQIMKITNKNRRKSIKKNLNENERNLQRKKIKNQRILKNKKKKLLLFKNLFHNISLKTNLNKNQNNKRQKIQNRKNPNYKKK